MSETEKDRPILDWGRCDIEQRLWFPGGRYTGVNGLLTGLLALLLTAGFYGVLATPWLRGSTFDLMFT